MALLLQLFVSSLLLGGVYTLLSVPLNLMFGTTRIVHFAYGEFLMIAMYATFWLHELYGIDPYVGGALLVTAAAVVVGFLAHVALFARLVRATHMTQILATLAVAIALQNLALMFWTADVRAIRTDYTNSTVALGSVRLAVPLVIASVVGVLGTIGLLLFLKRSHWGFALRAITQNMAAAEIVGIPIKRSFMLSVVGSTALLGLAGAVLVPVYLTSPTIGLDFSAIAFVVVVLGGLGSISGGVIAALLVGFVQSFAAHFIGIEWQTVVYFALFLVVLFIRPAGLLGTRGTEEMGIAI